MYFIDLDEAYGKQGIKSLFDQTKLTDKNINPIGRYGVNNSLDGIETNDVLTNDALTNDALPNDALTNDVLPNDALPNDEYQNDEYPDEPDPTDFKYEKPKPLEDVPEYDENDDDAEYGDLFTIGDPVLSVDVDEKADITAWFGNTVGGYRIKLDGKGSYVGAEPGDDKDIVGPLSVAEFGYTGFSDDYVQMQFKFDHLVDDLPPFNYVIDQPEGKTRDVFYTFEQDNMFSCIEATNVSSVEFRDGLIASVHAPEGEKTEYTAFLTAGDGIWDALVMEGCSNEFYVDYWPDGTIISSDNMKDLTITSFYYDNSATLNINTSADRICVRSCPENGPAGINAYISSDGMNEIFDVLIATSKKAEPTPSSAPTPTPSTVSQQTGTSGRMDYSTLLSNIRKQEPSFSQSAAQLKKAMTGKASSMYQRGSELVVHAAESESKLSIDKTFDWAYLKAAGAEYLVFEQKGASVLIPTDRTGALDVSLTKDADGYKLDISGGESAALRFELDGRPVSAKLQRLEGSEWVDCDTECVLMDVGGRRIMQTKPVPSGTYRVFCD